MRLGQWADVESGGIDANLLDPNFHRQVIQSTISVG